jgi:hypothetical protein
MKNYFLLNYSGTFAKYDTIPELPDVSIPWYLTGVRVRDCITAEALNFVKDTLKITPTHRASLFRGEENSETSIHKDSDACFALNYVWGDTESKMTWYRPIGPGTQSLTTTNTVFTSYKREEVEYVEELNVPNNRLILVRVDVPHHVVNFTNKKRYCLSLRSNIIIPYETIVEQLTPYLI